MTKAKFANTVEPDERAHNETSHLDQQSLPSSLWFCNILLFVMEVFEICKHK